MDNIPFYGDRRTLGYCAFCGGPTGTRDHCPSKVFLDPEYPGNLPVVPACISCNSGFSLDEEYLACLISCVLAGTTDPDKIPRKKISTILKRKSALRTRIEKSKYQENGNTIFRPEQERVNSVLVKLAKGHALFELHEHVSHAPSEVSSFPLIALNEHQNNQFQWFPETNMWPEVGSRWMQRLMTGQDMSSDGWITVQPLRYRYSVGFVDGIEIRIVIAEYLGCIVRWE